MADYVRVSVNFGSAPTGAGGDNNRAGIQKVDADLAQLFSSLTMDSSTNDVGVNRSPVSGFTLSVADTMTIIGDGGSAQSIITSYGGTPFLTTQIANGTEASPTVVVNGETLFRLDVRGYDGAGFDADGASIDAQASETWSASAHGNRLRFYSTANGATSRTLRITLDEDGNLLIGGTAAGTASEGNINLFNGIAPTAGPANGTILYSEDVSASSELKVMDEANNITVLSPHNFTQIPEGPSEEMAWSYYSERDGKGISVDMLKAIRILENLSGEKLVHEFTK